MELRDLLSTIRLFSFVLHEAPFGYAFTYNTAQGPSSRQAGTTAGWGDEKGKKPGFKPDAKVVGGIEISGAIEIRGLTAGITGKALGSRGGVEKGKQP